ncbi:mechanosensitive ion channel protein 10-like [Carica papaya]|uniref:mechanosensitive ion channel protein 10-like n=1 Tax=Carica papaya TaxID=3649 RepID=UPI000B8C8FE2|nr:mechanosensitive ion channel protein 10-like [Carica papaya]
METVKGMTEKKGTNDVLLQISIPEETDGQSKSYSASNNNTQVGSSPKGNVNDQTLELLSSTSPGTPAMTPRTPGKPPKIPTQPISRQNSLSSSSMPKPKSRFSEPVQAKKSSSPAPGSPVNRTDSVSKDSTGEEEEEDDDEVYKTAVLEVSKKKTRKRRRVSVLLEWTVFLGLIGILVASLTVDKLENTSIWSLPLWRWCILLEVIVCGQLVTEWFVKILVFSIERNFMLRKKVLYFVYGVKKSFRVFLWFGLILLAWGLLFNHGVARSRRTKRILSYITRALAAFLIGAALWLLKSLLVKTLAASFHVTRFFDRIQDSIFHQYVVQTLSGPPLMQMGPQLGRTNSQLSFRNDKTKKQEMVDVEKLNKSNQQKISAWDMKGLVDIVSGSGLYTLSHSLDSVHAEEEDQKDEKINSEREAKAAAYRIFRNVAKPDSRYIEEDDLLLFMEKEKVDRVFQLFEGAEESKKIKRKALKNWLVNVYLDRKSLAFSLSDSKTAIEELNRLGIVVVIVVSIIATLFLMGLLTTGVLLFISSQLLLIAFMFGNMAKTMFEAIIFVFVMHPFDVGDRCVIDGVQMVVEEVNILTTVFLRFDNEKIFYPNAVLATKPISNFYRSPEMCDAVEFSVHISTSMDQIGELKDRLKSYIEGKPEYWRPGHLVIVKEIENVNKMKMAVFFTHTINFQNYGDKISRRSELVLQLKNIFEDLNIMYQLLPQKVDLSYVGPPSPAFPPH